jgi:hypothetical protein
MFSPNNKTIRRREVCGLSYAGINRGQVQRVFLSLSFPKGTLPSMLRNLSYFLINEALT